MTRRNPFDEWLIDFLSHLDSDGAPGAIRPIDGIEANLRCHALTEANNSAERFSAPETVIARAEAYYAFLSGGK